MGLQGIISPKKLLHKFAFCSFRDRLTPRHPEESFPAAREAVGLSARIAVVPARPAASCRHCLSTRNNPHRRRRSMPDPPPGTVPRPARRDAAIFGARGAGASGASGCFPLFERNGTGHRPERGSGPSRPARRGAAFSHARGGGVSGAWGCFPRLARNGPGRRWECGPGPRDSPTGPPLRVHGVVFRVWAGTDPAARRIEVPAPHGQLPRCSHQ